MKATELRQKSVEELNVELGELHKQQFKLRMANATGQLTKNHQVGVVRKSIARIKTILTEKQGK
jgi:large subunit ribosomal protein L29